MGEHRYSVYGLTVASDLALPDLASAPEGPPADIEIVMGQAPEALGEAEIVRPTYQVAGRSGAARRFLIQVPGVARYLVEDGRRITVDPSDDGDEAGVRNFLFDTAFGAALHMRGLFPVQASAVGREGRAIAFCGPPTVGKSLAAFAMAERGWRVAADSLCAVELSAAARPGVLPGPPHLKLWRGTLAALGVAADGELRDGAGLERYRTPLPGIAGAAPLSHVVVMEEGASGAPAMSEPMARDDAAKALLANIYRPLVGKDLGLAGQGFQAAVAIAGRVPVSRLCWRADPAMRGRLADLVAAKAGE